MIGEPKPQVSIDVPDNSQHEANVGRLTELSSKNAGELSDDELETILADRKALKSAQTEAETENAEHDAEMARKATEAKVAEDAAHAEQAVADVAKVVEDAAKADALAAKLKKGEIGSSTEKNRDAMEVGNKNETRDLAFDQFSFKKMKEFLLGEAEVALSAGDMRGFQDAYVKMAENDIAELRIRIQGSHEDEKQPLLDKIEGLQSSIEILKSDPKAVGMRKNFNEGLSKVDVLENILAEAESTIRRERNAHGDGILYENAAIDASSKMEGAVRATLQYKDPQSLAFLKKTFGDVLPTTTVRLSPELQQQVRDLKI